MSEERDVYGHGIPAEVCEPDKAAGQTEPIRKQPETNRKLPDTAGAWILRGSRSLWRTPEKVSVNTSAQKNPMIMETICNRCISHYLQISRGRNGCRLSCSFEIMKRSSRSLRLTLAALILCNIGLIPESIGRFASRSDVIRGTPASDRSAC